MLVWEAVFLMGFFVVADKRGCARLRPSNELPRFHGLPVFTIKACKKRKGKAQRDRIRLFLGLCSTSASPNASKIGGM